MVNQSTASWTVLTILRNVGECLPVDKTQHPSRFEPHCNDHLASETGREILVQLKGVCTMRLVRSLQHVTLSFASIA